MNLLQIRIKDDWKDSELEKFLDELEMFLNTYGIDRYIIDINGKEFSISSNHKSMRKETPKG
jgi:hypothetical protein